MGIYYGFSFLKKKIHHITGFRNGDKFSGERDKYIKSSKQFVNKKAFLDKLVIKQLVFLIVNF